MWYLERKEKNRHAIVAKFHICCKSGIIILSLMKQPSPLLQQLLLDRTSHHITKFQANIRTYNATFSFTSTEMKFGITYSRRNGPPTLRLHGQTYHRIGTMLPETSEPP
ncbi:unnamed protein product [Lathyrus sativus]|nr:unnamed protein product [Lathyrus sativus]